MKYTICVPHSTRHVDRRVHGRADSRPFAHTTRQNMERECPNPDTNWNSRHECRDPTPCSNTKQGTQTRERTASSTLEDVHSHKNRTWRECQGSVIKPMNDTRPKRQRQETMIEIVLRINTLLNVNSCQSIVFSCCVTFLNYFDLRANREDMLLLFVISRGLLCLL